MEEVKKGLSISIASEQVLPFELTDLIYDKLDEIHAIYPEVKFIIRLATDLETIPK